MKRNKKIKEDELGDFLWRESSGFFETINGYLEGQTGRRLRISF